MLKTLRYCIRMIVDLSLLLFLIMSVFFHRGCPIATKISTYSTLISKKLFENSHFILLRCPEVTDHLLYNENSKFDITNDCILPEEISYGRIKENGTYVHCILAVISHNCRIEIIQTKRYTGNLRRLNMFVGGRIALRRCMFSLGYESNTHPILTDSCSGAPLLPSSISGSISHKDRLVAAYTILYDGRTRVGVDLERCSNKAADRMFNKILTEAERKNITNGNLTNIKTLERIMLLFSFKEAIFKAIHPKLNRSIGFQEVTTLLSSNDDDHKSAGSAEFDFSNLASNEKLVGEGCWEKLFDVDTNQNYFITIAKIRSD